MKKSKTGLELKEETHKEKPWKEAVRHKGIDLKNVISKKSMGDFFKEDKEIYQTKINILKFLPKHSLSNPDFNKFFIDMKDYTNNIARKKIDILAAISDLLTITTIDDQKAWESHLAYFNFPFSTYCMWPHQRPEEAVGSSLFFPEELIDPEEDDLILYNKPHIHILLAYSAKYRNPMALYHLSRILESYSGGEEDTLTAMSNDLLKAAQEAVASLEDVNEKNLPFYFVGQLFILLGDNSRGQRFLIQGDENRDGRATYQLALLEKDQEKRKNLYQRSYHLGYKKALLGLARTNNCLDTRFELYKKAGEEGIAEGYSELEAMIRRGYSYKGEGSIYNIGQGNLQVKKMEEIGEFETSYFKTLVSIALEKDEECS